MGTEMVAYIEYDDATDRWHEFHPDPADQPPPPFSPETEPYSLTPVGGIYTGSKDYLFFAAIAGVRNETEIPPLHPPRGLPPNPSPEVRADLDSHGQLGEHNTGWLRPSEVDAALDHQRVPRALLSFETHTILAILANLATRLGDARVRLVFGFS